MEAKFSGIIRFFAILAVCLLISSNLKPVSAIKVTGADPLSIILTILFGPFFGIGILFGDEEPEDEQNDGDEDEEDDDDIDIPPPPNEEEDPEETPEIEDILPKEFCGGNNVKIQGSFSKESYPTHNYYIYSYTISACEKDANFRAYFKGNTNQEVESGTVKQEEQYSYGNEIIPDQPFAEYNSFCIELSTGEIECFS